MIKINMGCGWRNFGEDWVHIDGGDYDHLDHNDITSLPFKNNTVDLIYASHVIEYMDREDILTILQEWKRVLKEDAILRIAVPDFYMMAKLYLLDSRFTLKNFLGPLYGKMSMGEKKIYHKTTYDFDSLKTVLEDSGFRNVVRYDWKETDHSDFDDHSQAYLPHMDKENGILMSLNVECNK
tara:strand:+ start:815 stop:1357 length:543 start_codon:yes stop_codon:yes gene_type:complete